MSKAKVKVQSKSKSLLDRIGARLDKRQSDDPAKATFEHARSTEDSPTYIRYVVTTGIRAFDDRVGGMPVGKAIELCGLPKSGKTNMAVRTCVRAQQGFIYERVQAPDGSITLQQLEEGAFNVTVVYYDNEGSLSDFNHRQIDGTVMDGEIIQCELIEELWASMDDIMEEVEKEEQETGIIQFLIVVIDTVGIMTTQQEMASAWGKQDFPRVPYQIKAGFKQMTSRMQRDNVMLIGLNHVSKKMERQYGRVAFKGWAYDSPGGMAFSYCATIQIYFEMLEKKYCLRGKGEADGLLIYFMTKKNRMLPPLRQGRLALLFAVKDRTSGKLIREGGIKDLWSILETLIFAKAAKVNDKGAITFYLEKFGIEPQTFGAQEQTPSLEEQDDDAPPVRRPGRAPGRRAAPEVKKKDPRIAHRLAWVDFYAQHQADMDALYGIVTDRALHGSELNVPGTENDIDEDEEDDDEENED